MKCFDHELAQRLAALNQQGLLRSLRCISSPQEPRIQVEGRSLLNFSSNDYLGLANHPEVTLAAIKAIETYGAGAGSSRLISGSLAPHHQLDEALASFKGTQAALTFSSDYTAAVGTICALMGKQNIIIIDKHVHASIVDAAHLSGAKLRVFHHNNLNDLEKILQWVHRGSSASLPSRITHPSSTALATEDHAPVLHSFSDGGSRISPPLIITESIFSMDGDRAPLPDIVALKEKYGAWLMVDEAHATGLYGPNHRGIADECGLGERIEVQMGTLGKAIGAAGGYICGSRTLIDYLINRARPFIFSTAPVPAAAAAAMAGIRLAQTSEGNSRRNSLWQRISQLSSKLKLNNSQCPSAIFPLLIGSEKNALQATDALRQRDIFIPAIRYPTVPRGKARLRITLSASHSAADIQALLAALTCIKPITDDCQMQILS